MSALRKILAVGVPLAIVATAGVNGSAEARSAAPLAALLSRDVHVDYDPLASPRDAVAMSDLAVRGRLVAITEGVHAVFRDPMLTHRASRSYVTFVVEVTEVLSGDPAHVTDGKVYVRVRRGAAAPVDALREVNTRPDVVLVLDDVTNAVPRAAARVARPAGIPASARLFAPFTDGIWLQGAADRVMHGIGVSPDELASGWAGVRTVDAFARALRAARG